MKAINHDLVIFNDTYDRALESDDGSESDSLFESYLEPVGSEGFELPTLKKFRIDFDVLDCYMLMILITNKDTLKELHFGGTSASFGKATLMLQKKSVRMEKVVNLSMFILLFSGTSLLDTRAVYPHVEIITIRQTYPEDTDVLEVLGI